MKITILYGSETGTAQDVAEQIWKNAKRFCYCPSSIIYIEIYFVSQLESLNLLIIRKFVYYSFLIFHD